MIRTSRYRIRVLTIAGVIHDSESVGITFELELWRTLN